MENMLPLHYAKERGRKYDLVKYCRESVIIQSFTGSKYLMR